MPILFALTLFVSALLLFMVQPMIGRMILPLLGGSPAAWNTCMVFFQFMLLLGYLYAHKLSARLNTRQQVLVHCGVLTVTMAAFAAACLLSERGSPVAVVRSLAPQDTAYPMFGVMALLFVAIGVPFFAVSATAPLLQRWFSKTGHRTAGDPYFLYAASNAGSLLSLLLYPLVTEPQFKLNEQAWLFAGGFVALAGMIIACATFVPKSDVHETKTETTAAAPPSNLRIFKWIILAFVPSSLLLGVTFYMTTDIASIPLLWVIPLALYLLTFIIAFARTRAWLRVVLGNAAPVMTLLLLFVIITMQPLWSPFALIALHLTAYFLLALMCHSELARDRPPPQFLTNFFLWISVGGVLGGIFNALVAPVLFPLAYEYPIALCLGCLMVPKLSEQKSSNEKTARLLDLFIPLIMLVVVANLTAFGDADWLINFCRWTGRQITAGLQAINLNGDIDGGKVHDGVLWALPLIACFFFIDRPLRFGLCVAAVVFVGEFRRTSLETYTERSFFGILKIQDTRTKDSLPFARTLVHGTTIHGKQALTPWPLRDTLREPLGALVGGAPVFGYDWAEVPLTYYHHTGPVGHMFAVTKERHPKSKVAMVGLGTGSVSTYANEKLDLTFYEIDPTVKKLVADRRRHPVQPYVVGLDGKPNREFDFDRDPFFTFVIDAERRGAKIDFVLGDARLKLEENKDVRYDLLLVDAFSSDSIPVHLLTKEALQLYMSRLTPDGLLALHISNKFVKLDVVVARLAEELGLTAMEFNDSWFEKDEHSHYQYAPAGKTPSSWCVLAKDPARLEVFKEPRFMTQYRYADPGLTETRDGQVVKAVPSVNEWKPMTANPQVAAWTDDYADVLMVMQLKEIQRLRKLLGQPTLDELLK